jgi:hypothetical protein
VRFDYYDSLSPTNQAIYRASDDITAVPIDDPAPLLPLAEAIREALAAEKVGQVRTATARLGRELLGALGVRPVTIKVLAKRPNRHGEELHGVYVREEGERPVITVWMRTAAKKRVVTFRTFLRTLLHEICHHLDYELHGLKDTFHTEGFFKRESSLMNALAPRSAAPKPRPKQKPAPEPKAQKPRAKREQLKLDI